MMTPVRKWRMRLADFMRGRWYAVVPTFDWLFHHVVRWFWLSVVIAGLGLWVLRFVAQNGWHALSKFAIVIAMREHPALSIGMGGAALGAAVLTTVIAWRAHLSPHAHPDVPSVVSIRRLNLADLRYNLGINPKRYFPRPAFDGQVREALRRANSDSKERTVGVIVFGIPMVGKTRLVLEALRSELSNYQLLLWRKRFGSLPLTTFDRFRGKRLVLMFNDIQEFANKDEASSVLDAVERLLEVCRPLIVVATSRTGIDQNTTENVFAALVGRLERITVEPMALNSEEAGRFIKAMNQEGVKLYEESFDGTPGSVVLGLGRRTSALRDRGFPADARKVLQTLALLRYVGIYVYPVGRVRRVAEKVFGLSNNSGAWRDTLALLLSDGWVALVSGVPGEPVLRLPTDAYLDTCVAEAGVYPIPSVPPEGDFRDLVAALSNSGLPPDGDALFSLSVALRTQSHGNQAENARLAMECATTGLSQLSSTQQPELWARGKNTLGIAYALLDDDRYLQAAFDAFSDALSIRTREAYPIKWAEITYNRALVRRKLASVSSGSEECHKQRTAAIDELHATLDIFRPEYFSEDYREVESLIQDIAALSCS